MSTRLLESDFFTVNLQNIIKLQNVNKAKVSAEAGKINSEPNEETQGTENSAEIDTSSENSESELPKLEIKDWEAELNRRLAKNQALGAGARESEYAVKSKFFKDFYTAVWGKALAKELILIGEPLKKAFEVMKFSENTNPIYKFLTLSYVKNELLKTRLLNSNTFKAIYMAVSRKLTPQSEFFEVNSYNLLYCRDFYRCSPTTMIEYLELQKELLAPGASAYKAETLINNRKIFLHATANTADSLEMQAKDQKATPAKAVPKMTDTKAQLNSLELAKKIKEKLGIHSSEDRDKQLVTHLGPKALQKIADDITDKPKSLAMIQFLSMTTQSSKARKALSDDRLSGVSTSELLKATQQIAGVIKGQLQATDADYLVDLILHKL